jgi:hypothetical protein
MSRGRTYYGVSDFKTINKELGIKVGRPAQDRKYDENKRKSQRAKFCKCPKCKGMMTYVPNTNTLVCDNIVKKTKEKTLSDGSKTKIEVEERCGNVNVVSNQYVDYLAYLFDGVAPDIAVTEAERSKKNKENK